MASDESLKCYLLELAASGVRFENLDNRFRMLHSLQHRTNREIRLALNSLTFNPEFKPVVVAGTAYPPLKRQALEREEDGSVTKTAYVPRVNRALPSRVSEVQRSAYFVAS
jgi:hypothetical protein